MNISPRLLTCCLLLCLPTFGCGEQESETESALGGGVPSNPFVPDLSPASNDQSPGETDTAAMVMAADPTAESGFLPAPPMTETSDDNPVETTPVVPPSQASETETEMDYTPDGNDDFEASLPLASGIVTGAIDGPGDRDYFNFIGLQGQWIVLDTVANPNDDTGKLDTVIRLYDQQMQLVAENNDRIPRVNSDSELIVRLPLSSRYYVEVLDYSDWERNPDPAPLGSSNYRYTLNFRSFTSDLEVVTLAMETWQ